MSANCQNLRILTIRLSAILISLIILQQCDFSKAAALYKSQDASLKAGGSCRTVCTSQICSNNAAFFRSIMKPTLDPCDDFYQFVCGNFTDTVDKSFPKKMNDVNISLLVKGQMEISLGAMLNNVKPNDISAIKKLKIYYQNCMNENHMEADGVDPVLNILENIGGWPLLLGENWNELDFDWKDTVYKIHNEKFQVLFPTQIIVTRDMENSTNLVPRILPAATRIGKSFFLGDSGEKLKTVYFNFIVNVSAALGADKDKIYEEVKDMFNFEMDLYKMKTNNTQKKSLEQTKMTLKELSEKYSYIPWLELFNLVFKPSGIAIDDSEFVIIEDLEYIKKLTKLIDMTPKRVLANYLAWQVVQFSLGFMPSEFRKLKADFLNQVNETTQSPDIPKDCLSEVMEYLQLAVSAMYIREVFDQSIKDDVNEIFSNIKKQSKRNLERISWMDDQTLKHAIEKLEAINAIIGHADDLLEDDKVNGYYKNLEINSGSYFHSALNLSKFIQTGHYEILRHPPIYRTMHENVLVPGAYFMPQSNSIGIPAGILRGPFFLRDRPQYLNYGAIGSVIGHEITHAFDSNGRKLDKSGNLKNWWEPNTEKQYLKKARCIIDQYSNFTVDQIKFHVNGDKTQDENIADNGGFRVAYLAYKEWAKTQRVPEGCLPNLNYTPQQMFWISAASCYCNKHSSEYLTNLIMTDVHSPAVSRILISFSNIKEFAEDFQCKPNTRMNPKEKCVLW